MSNLAAVHAIYEAFGRGDVPAILRNLSEDVDWEYGSVATDVPWLQRRRGHDGAAAFFTSLGALDIQRFNVKALFEGTNVVVALIDAEFVVAATGRRVQEEDEVHIWHFDDSGKVTRFRHRVDSEQHARALRG